MLLVAALMLGSLAASVSSLATLHPPTVEGPGPTEAVAAAAGTPVRGFDPAPPAGVEIPRLGIRSDLVDLNLNPDGSLAVPADFSRAGWWAGGHRPGSPGPAVIVGHVDSGAGPAVFHRLRAIEKGDLVIVHLADGARVEFSIDEVGQYGKSDFPTELVYGATGEAAIRLITCGGEFDRSRRSYEDNIVAFGRLVADGA